MPDKMSLMIADPCHEKWSAMSPVEQGRFCKACQKPVIDFTEMSDGELADFFSKERNGSVCGRFFRDQLKREISKPRRRPTWYGYFIRFTLPAIFLSMKATAQGKVRLSVPCTRPPVTLTGKPGPAPADITTGITAAVVDRPAPARPAHLPEWTIHGRVYDPNGDPLPFATIAIKGTGMAAMSGEDGRFTLLVNDSRDSVVLSMSCVGYGSLERLVSREDSNVRLEATKELVFATMGAVVIVKKKKKKKPKIVPLAIDTIPAFTRRLMDTAFRYFRVYPNPVARGKNLHIEWKNEEMGYFRLALTDVSGKTFFTREIWIDAEARLLTLEIPPVPAGNYFLQAVHRSSGRKSTEQVVVE